MSEDNRQALIERSIPFLAEVRNRTAGDDLESWLNTTYGPDSELYQDLARLIRIGVLEEGWAANIEVDGPRYRRSLIAEPSAETHYFSITAVYMDSVERYRGQYHAHPYGELNLVAPIDPGAQLVGPNGWQGAGWTAPAPGSHHYPEVRGGALIALFYLPAGRISYDIHPSRSAGAAG
ncbi:hypothetical protein SRB17_82390 [Streptomyces sp. RB17]|uniref:DUF4863 family protein n=1 Tax=Streptomyces sp. RB17 TaxID=2585197 RepID=UPI0012981461|nr:DUF4863 family protein [Streptomyces sp. RB17]MQY40208.1 hypothetical protein [Streptomyces sp. RB17]